MASLVRIDEEMTGYVSVANILSNGGSDGIELKIGRHLRAIGNENSLLKKILPRIMRSIRNEKGSGPMYQLAPKHKPRKMARRDWNGP